MPKITIRVANAEKLETQFLPELASGGLFIRSDKFLPLGAEVDIDLYLPSATEALPLKGRVTRVVDDDDSRARKATGMTLAVDANSEPTRSRLDALYTAYKISVRRAPASNVTPGSPANGSYGQAVPLPSPYNSNGAIPLPPPGLGDNDVTAAIPLPSPASMGNALPAADDDLPAFKPPSIAPPSVAPAIPPAFPPRVTPSSVPVLKFDKPNGNGSAQKHPDFDPYADAFPAGTPPDSPPPLDEQATDHTPIRPLPFPFQRSAAPAPSEVPGFKALTHQGDSSAPAAAGADTAELEARVRELEVSEAKAKEQARKAGADRDALEARHAEATKRLNEEIAALQRKPAGGPAEKRSVLPAALIGLLMGAAATGAYFMLAAPSGPATGAVLATGPAIDSSTKTPSGTELGSGSTATGPTVVAAASDAGSDSGPVNAVAVVAPPAAVVDAGAAVVVAAAKDAGSGSGAVAQADVGGTKTEVKPEVKPEVVAVNPEQVEEVAPPLAVENKKPVEKKAVGKRQGDAPIGENAGVLNLRADFPATVFVNGKKVGNAPALGVKANPGKVTVRFDCVVEDVRVRGKNRTVNLAANGSANIDYSCTE